MTLEFNRAAKDVVVPINKQINTVVVDVVDDV